MTLHTYHECEYCLQTDFAECIECAQQRQELEQEAEADKEEANGTGNNNSN